MKARHALIIFFVLFSLLPTFYELTNTKKLHPERAFELIHNFPTDYNFYLSRIRQGLEGKWLVTERYTSEPHNPSLIHEAYLLMGQVGRFARVPVWRSADIYHVARIVLAIAFLFAVAHITKTTVTFLLAITASSWPILVFVEGFPRFGGYMPWWSVMDSLQRITFIPHILAGQILIIFLIYALTIIKKHAVFLGLLSFLLGMVFPPGLVFVMGVIGVHWALTDRSKKTFLFYGSVFLIGSASIAYLLLMTSFYPWKRLAEVDRIRPLPFDYMEYFKAVGPIGVFGFIGLIWAMMKKEKSMYPAVAWVLAWLLFLVVFRFIPSQSPLRFSEMLPHVPLAILSAYLFMQKKNVGNMLASLLICVGLLHMTSSFLWQKDFVDHKMRATVPLVPYDSFVMYPLKDFLAAMYVIHDNFPGDSVILAEMTASNYLPVYAGNRVYIGHDNTVKLEEKREVVKRFFTGATNQEELKSFLKKHAIRAVFYGPQEKEVASAQDLHARYPFLQEVYKNAFVTVYAVEN